MLLDGAKEQGRFPPLNSLQGQVNVLVLVGRLVPLGVWHADLYDFGYATLFRMAPYDAARFAKHMIGSMKGPGPVLKFFLPPQPNYHVTADDYLATHRVAADVMRANPRIRAIFQSNWYLDPVVAEISPHLAFLSRFATSHGSIIGRVGTDDEVVRESTWKSGNRKRLYEAGRYVPMRYYRLWPRDAVLRWAESAPAPAAPARRAPPLAAGQGVGTVSPGAGPAAAGRVVLVVDEDVRFQRLASEAVKAEGHQVSVAGDVAMALAMIARVRQVDLLIAAIALSNGGNGVRLAQEVRRHSPGANVVLTSNYLESGDAGHAAYKMAGAKVLTKPRTMEEVAQLVRAALGAARSAPATRQAR
jgi:CheY-like chemotaxis protein